MAEDQQESLRAVRDRQAAQQLLASAGRQASDIVRAIELAEGAVVVHRRTGPPEECAESWYVLGTAWWTRQDGEPEENLEQALDAMMYALDLRGQVGPREEWARVLANIGALYWQRVEGDRSDNIERAIGACRAAADGFDVRASQEQAEQWVITTKNLATGYLHRRVGDQTSNVEAAIAAIEAIAEFHRARGHHVEWIRTQNWLANTLIEYLSGRAGQHVERAIEIFTGVLGIAGMPEDDRAMTEVNLALAYMRRLQGDHRQNVERATSYCRSCLGRHSSAESGVVAQAHGTLGVGLLTLGSKPADVEAAIEHLRRAVDIFRRTGPLKELAKAQFNLGDAYWRRTMGDIDDNREEALATWFEASQSFTYARVNDHEPSEFSSDIENAVGVAYLDRRRGDRGDNIEHAIAAFWRATLVFPEDSTDHRLAIARHNLGSAYQDRILGDKVENLRSAREALEAASRVRTRQRAPLDWALTETTLGVVYAKLAEAGQGGHLADRAIEAHRAALEVLDPVQHAEEWQKAQSNLATAYVVRSRYERSDDVDSAISTLEAIVEPAPGPAGPSVGWFVAAQGLGTAYLRRDHGRGGPDSQRAIQVWQTCLDQHARASLPGLRRTTARHLGDWFLQLGRWSEAADAYVIAVEATNELYRAAFLAGSRNAELASGGDTFVRAAYAMVRSDPDQAADAVLVLEQGRARSLADQLFQDSIEQTAAGSDDPELYKSYTETLASLREIEAVLQDGSAIPWLISHGQGIPQNLVDNEDSRRVAERLLSSMVSTAQERLADITRKIRNNAANSSEPNTSPDLASLAAAAIPDVPVAYLACTPFGSVVLVLSRGTGQPVVEALLVDDLDEADLRRVLGLSRGNRSGPPGYVLGQLGLEAPLKPYVQKSLAGLGARLIRPLAEWLARHSARGVALVPCGLLGLLPLHAVPVVEAPAGRCLLDDFDVSYAPSAAALGSAREAVTNGERAHQRLAGVADPNMDRHLRWARIELAAVAEHFQDQEIHSGAAATKAALMVSAKDASHVHFACHGKFDVAAPLSSGFALADGMLTIADVVRDRPFVRARLVVASACQTAITDFSRVPDEVVGLPTAFLAAGTPAVIGTLWPTDDLSAALLMARFYRFHLHEMVPPAAALRAAQLWLRAMTGEQLAAEIESLSPMLTAVGVSEVLEVAAQEPTTRFYESPAYWAPYVIVGV